MAQRFFRGPDGSTWAADDPAERHLAAYPKGTVEIAASEMTVAVTSSLSLADRRAAAVLPREIFAENAATASVITWEEAANWTAGNALPSVVQPLMDATPAAERGKLIFTLLARRNVRRMAPEIIALGTIMGKTDAQIDALFGL